METSDNDPFIVVVVLCVISIFIKGIFAGAYVWVTGAQYMLVIPLTMVFLKYGVKEEEARISMIVLGLVLVTLGSFIWVFFIWAPVLGGAGCLMIARELLGAENEDGDDHRYDMLAGTLLLFVVIQSMYLVTNLGFILGYALDGFATGNFFVFILSLPLCLLAVAVILFNRGHTLAALPAILSIVAIVIVTLMFLADGLFTGEPLDLLIAVPVVLTTVGLVGVVINLKSGASLE